MSGIVKKSAAAFGVLGLSGIGIFAAPLAAEAAPVCSAVPGLPAPTLITSGICEIRVTAVGTVTATFPTSGISKVSAVLVGGGGGGFDVDTIAGYGGSGGSVTYVDTVVLNPAGVVITVGAGGLAGNRSDGPTVGAPTSVGADSAPGGGEGGSDGPPGQPAYYSGAGAGGPTSDVGGITPGPGRVIQTLSGIDATLFPSTPAAASDPVAYAPGGQGSSDASNAPATTPGVAGAGGAGLIAGGTSTPGINGLVILRFAPYEPAVTPAPPVPQLAETGSSTTPGLIGALGLVSVGAIIVALRRRLSRETA